MNEMLSTEDEPVSYVINLPKVGGYDNSLWNYVTKLFKP